MLWRWLRGSRKLKGRMQSPGRRPQERGDRGANSVPPVAVRSACSWSGPQRALGTDLDSYLVNLIDSLGHGWEGVPPKSIYNTLYTQPADLQRQPQNEAKHTFQL